jgi:hypothetical protein
MRYEQRILCFLDVLGFAEQVRRTVRDDGSDDESRIDQIAGVFATIRGILDIDRPADRNRKEVTQFSDSIVISFPVDEESGVFYALLEILWVQISLVHRQMLCRGAVVVGRVIHTPHLLFGPAIVDAYTLESRAANYPRVILDESIIELGAAAHARHHLAEHERESILQLVTKDGDGMYYIDYITAAQSELNDPDLDYPEYLMHLGRIIAAGIASVDRGDRGRTTATH